MERIIFKNKVGGQICFQDPDNREVLKKDNYKQNKSYWNH